MNLQDAIAASEAARAKTPVELSELRRSERAALVQAIRVAWSMIGADYGGRPKPAKIRKLLLEDPRTVLQFVPEKLRALHQFHWWRLSPASRETLALEALPD